ncbi:unnamed protein product, partial [Clonostachys rosea f. rosea IK726]
GLLPQPLRRPPFASARPQPRPRPPPVPDPAPPPAHVHPLHRPVHRRGTLANSGYSIVPGIFLGGIARRTAVHYASKGKANYGAWGFLDWVNGTSRGGDVLEDVKDEAEKHRLKERSSKKVDEGAGLIQDGIDALTNGTGTRRSTRKRTPRKTG